MSRPRIALIHATALSVAPVAAAFAAHWPDAELANVLDDSLAPDRQRAAMAPETMFARFRMLTDYAVTLGARGILFTCSAFGREIDAARRGRDIPILKPNEAMFGVALHAGARIGLIATFEPSIPALSDEFAEAARASGREVECVSLHAAGAFEALRQGDGGRHDVLVADAACRLPDVDAIMLAQFSMARARDAVAAVRGAIPVLTSPEAAVRQLRARIEHEVRRHVAIEAGRCRSPCRGIGGHRAPPSRKPYSVILRLMPRNNGIESLLLHDFAK